VRAITVMPMERGLTKLSVAWAVMLILWEIKATINLQNDQAGNNTQGQFSGSASCRDTCQYFFYH